MNDPPGTIRSPLLRTAIVERELVDLAPSDATRSVRGASLEDAMVMIWHIFQLLRPKLSFEPAYPSYLLDQPQAAGVKTPPALPDETVTWSVIRQEPGSQSPTPFGGDRELRPRLRETNLPNPAEWVSPSGSPTTALETYGQAFDSIVQFDCWAPTNFETERLAEFVRNTLQTHAGAIQRYGVSRMYFWRRLRDEFIGQFRSGQLARSVQFYFRTEHVYTAAIPLIRRIDLVLQQLRVAGRPWAELQTDAARLEASRLFHTT